MNIPEMIKYSPKLAEKLDKICQILHEDGYYPKNKIYETAIAILTETASWA
jgi:hypothetical protein